MKVIYKYQIKEKFRLELPVEARILSVQSQGDVPQMWVMLDPEAPKVVRAFYTFATGEKFDDTGLTYLGTFQLIGGGLIFHVFEVNTLAIDA